MQSKLTIQRLQSPPGGLNNIPFVEHVPRGQFSGEASFGVDTSQATMVVDIPIASGIAETDQWPIVKAISQILGYSKKGNNKKISRFLPMRHPLYHWLWATKILSVHPYRPGTLLQESAGVYNLNLGDNTVTKYNTDAAPVNEKGTGFAAFKAARITILFTTLPYSIYEDADINPLSGTAGEFIRYTTREMLPTAQFLVRPVGSLKWVDGPSADSVVATGSQHQMVIKTRLRWTWHQVPDIGLFDGSGSDQGGFPTYLVDIIGKVNQTSFFGYPIGTLLMEAPEFIPINLPCPPAILGLNNKYPPRAWNVVVNMLHFDPPAGTTNRGHNLLPHSNGLWYKVYNTDDPTKSLYEEGEFQQIFWMN